MLLPFMKPRPSRRHARAALRVASLICLLALLPSCTTVRFLSQAAAGQWRLNKRAEPIAELLAKPTTDERTRQRLAQVLSVKAYGDLHGLDMHANYETYVELERPYVVWFVNASHPLAFLPLTFGFPIVGGFPGLSWFDEERAKSFAEQLGAQGWDVHVRGVSAFSTGGWFDDPVLSTMFYEHPAQIGFLANTILHESLHATVLIPNQQFFNESLASFVADTMTPDYLSQAYPDRPHELSLYLQARETSKQMVKVLVSTFEQLNQLYLSTWSDEQKLAEKARVIDELIKRLPFETRPNNATLIGFQLYQEGSAEFEALFAACQRQWPRFIEAVDSLRADHFAEPQTIDIGPTVQRLVDQQCLPLPTTSQPPPLSKQLRQRAARRGN